MRKADLAYNLPPDRIAQQPAEPRDASRLLVLHRAARRMEHRTFRDIQNHLRPGDCLVLNDTRVIPARFFCRRDSGGRIEAFFLRTADDGWRVLLKPSARLRIGERLAVDSSDATLTLTVRHDRGEWTVMADPATDAIHFLDTVGQTPLPPYIQRGPNSPPAPEAVEGGSSSPPSRGGGGGGSEFGIDSDRLRYQTVYARDPGAVAAPTAGLHFTPELLQSLSDLGVQQAAVTLHVGLGTFAAIDVDDLAAHRMHAEWFEVSAAALDRLNVARAVGGRIVAVGTTSARVLETLAQRGTIVGEAHASSAAQRDWTDIFIYPPYQFRNVDALLTNFHLPESTLLALVMAFAGIAEIRAAYAAAIAEQYRFYSYGDAMLIL